MLNISLNNNAITNGAGYTTNTCNGTVTSVATGNGLTGGTITSTGTLSMLSAYPGSYTINGSLTVGNTTSSDIYMTDTDETTRRIHCNSNRIGFLNSSNGWGAYCDNTGNWAVNGIVYATGGNSNTWNSHTSNTGTVTSVATGSGLTGGTITTTGTLSVDSTVVRTTG